MSSDINPEVLNLPTWFLDDASLDALAGHPSVSPTALAVLTGKAEALLDVRAESVMDKQKNPPSGDKHDYMSLAIYTWPNPDTPDGLPYIHKDGLVNPEIRDYDLPRQGRMIGNVTTLALATHHTGNDAYGRKAAELLRVWFLDKATRMNPHLDFGQGIPGECDGRCYGVIETTGLLKVAGAVRILERKGLLPEQDAAGLQEWYAAYAAWLRTSEIGTAEGRTTNNHRIWHMAQLAGYLLFIGDADAARDVLSAAYPAILEQQMEPDGSLPRELARTRSLHYVVFALVPLLMSAAMGRSLGLDLAGVTNSAGASVRTGVDWLLPYLLKDKEWAWEQVVEDDPAESEWPLLRMAANVLGVKEYEDVLRKAAGDGYDDLTINLIIPMVSV